MLTKNCLVKFSLLGFLNQKKRKDFVQLSWLCSWDVQWHVQVWGKNSQGLVIWQCVYFIFFRKRWIVSVQLKRWSRRVRIATAFPQPNHSGSRHRQRGSWHSLWQFNTSKSWTCVLRSSGKKGILYYSLEIDRWEGNTSFQYSASLARINVDSQSYSNDKNSSIFYLFDDCTHDPIPDVFRGIQKTCKKQWYSTSK